ncbi:MAG: hypothetical protein SWH78_01770 [Thermodesulfobacteriota bacterium]|nr:hypothetical protein [Thermodesulfobacteriota bacterium]
MKTVTLFRKQASSLFSAVEEGEVLKDEEGLANMRHLGKSIDWLGKTITPHIRNYPKSSLFTELITELQMRSEGALSVF